jgi:hypothetical protein
LEGGEKAKLFRSVAAIAGRKHALQAAIMLSAARCYSGPPRCLQNIETFSVDVTYLKARHLQEWEAACVEYETISTGKPTTFCSNAESRRWRN